MKEEKDKIIIPAYEPDKRLISLLKDLYKSSDSTLIVVNDGSSQIKDDIFMESEAYAIVLRHDKNYGKGAAVKTALEYIKSVEPGGRIVIADADGQHNVHDILFLLKIAAQNKKALIIGSRSFHGSIPLRSRIGNQITRVVFKLLSGKWLKDTQTGLRAFDSSLIPRFLSVPGERYEYEINMLFLCIKGHIDLIEIPIETIYFEGNKSSHFHVLKDSARIYKSMLKFASSSFLSFILDYFLYSFLLYSMSGLKLISAAVISNVAARMASAAFNYYINRRYVFKYRETIWSSAVKYGILAVMILIVNTLMLVLLVKSTGINAWAAKAIVESCLFILNFMVQKLFIFNKGKRLKK